MVVRAVTRCAAALWLCLACEPPDSGDSSSDGDTGDTTTTGGPASGKPCEVDGERRCRERGLGIFVCESAQWASRTCDAECKRQPAPGCSLGCIITAEGEDCLCVPSSSSCS